MLCEPWRLGVLVAKDLFTEFIFTVNYLTATLFRYKYTLLFPGFVR